MKRIFAILLTACLLFSLTACGGSEQESTTTAAETTATAAETTEAKADAGEDEAEETTAEAEVDVSEWPVISMEILSTDDMHLQQEVQDAMNKRLVELNAGAQIDFIPMTFGDRSTVLTLMLTDASDPIDLFCWRFYSTVKNLANNNQAICLDEYRDVYPELWEMYPEAVYWINEENSQCYSIPNSGSFCAVQVYSVRKDLLDEAGISCEQGQRITMDELTEIDAALEALHPEMCWQGSTATFPMMGVDYLGNSNAIGALLNRGVDETEIVNLYETETFRDYCETMKLWADSGFFINDPLNNSAPGSSNINEGTCGGFLWDSCNIDHAKSIMDAQIPDYEIQMYFVSDTVRDNSCVYNGWCISTVCANPDAAMSVLYYLCTDAELTTYVTLGIEGESYELDENGCAWYCDGVTAENAGWLMSCSWFYPNEALTPPFETDFATKFSGLSSFWTDPDIATSNGMGFIFDKTEFYDQYTACEASVSEYRSALLYGQCSDIDAYLAEFNEELQDNGIADILEEENRQFTAFLEAHAN